MQKIVCTYDDFDKYIELFQKMNFKAMDYAPSKEELLNVIFPNLSKYIVLLMWIDETGYDTDENMEARSLIRKALTSQLELVN